LDQIKNGLDDPIFNFCHDVRFGDSFYGRVGLLRLGCLPTQLRDDIPDFLFGKQSLPFQHFHESRDGLHVGDGQFENGDGFFRIEFFSHA
jgi:hypothetical protein